ncbi:snare protein YKT6 [Flagelloscypha sp. PMI_526]|nr:snare protein YKT6 [Flagelloscypha sp. PMI_526]
MKVLSLSILHNPASPPATLLVSASDLSSFSFYQRGAVGEMLTFLTRTVAERTKEGQRQSVQEGSHTAHVYNRGGGLTAVIVTDEEYPVRAAFSVLTKVLDEFSQQVPESSWSTPSSISFPALNTYLQKYQDPRQADTIMRVQQELDETKIVLHKTIESVLQRGEKLDTLVDRSNNLSMQSKMFYKTAKKQNSCCVVM